MGNTLCYMQTRSEWEPAIIDKITANYNKAAPKTENINLLTFNMFVRPPFINNNGEDYKDERLLEFISVMHNYDIICLQEMFASYSRRREALVEHAKNLGFRYHCASPRPSTLAVNRHFIDGGLLILSRYPIVASEFRPYPLGLGIDSIVQKGVLYAEIEIGESRLHIYNTHTQANYNGDSKCAVKRAEHFMAFRKFIEESLVKHEYRQDDIVLMCGDFNVNARSGMMRHEKEPVLPKSITLCHMASPPGEYDAVLGYLSNSHKDIIEDVIKKDLGEHPLTFGDYTVDEEGRITPIETVLTGKHSWGNNESLDYILKLTPKELLEENPHLLKAGNRTDNALVIKDKSTTIEKFLVEGYPFTQLSDHYGVKVVLQYKELRKGEYLYSKTLSMDSVTLED